MFCFIVSVLAKGFAMFFWPVAAVELEEVVVGVAAVLFATRTYPTEGDLIKSSSTVLIIRFFELRSDFASPVILYELSNAPINTVPFAMEYSNVVSLVM
jgi:hypothetical protein